MELACTLEVDRECKRENALGVGRKQLLGPECKMEDRLEAGYTSELECKVKDTLKAGYTSELECKVKAGRKMVGL